MFLDVSPHLPQLSYPPPSHCVPPASPRVTLSSLPPRALYAGFPGLMAVAPSAAEAVSRAQTHTQGHPLHWRWRPVLCAMGQNHVEESKLHQGCFQGFTAPAAFNYKWLLAINIHLRHIPRGRSPVLAGAGCVCSFARRSNRGAVAVWRCLCKAGAVAILATCTHQSTPPMSPPTAPRVDTTETSLTSVSQ